MSVKIRPRRGQKGVWEVDIHMRLPDGSKYRKRMNSPVPSKSGSERWANDHVAHVLRTWNQPAPVEAPAAKEVKTLAEFKETFLEHARANKQKPSTIEGKEAILDYRLVPRFGHKPLNEILDADVDALKASMSKLSPKTVNNTLVVLNKLLKLAVKYGELAALPVKIELLRYEPPEMEFYEFEQYELAVEAATKIDPRHLALVLLGGDAGLRAGEMLGLEQTDADYRRGVLHIQRAIWRGQVTLPKGGKKRKVPMTERLARALKAIKHLRGDRVFYRDPVGTEAALLASQQTLRSWMGAVQKRAGLRQDGEAGLHILRHTFCSHLAMRGVPAVTIKELAGHRSLSTTMRYMHLSPSEADRAIRVLESGRQNHGANTEQAKESEPSC